MAKIGQASRRTLRTMTLQAIEAKRIHRKSAPDRLLLSTKK